jgi:hypothetical protein
MNRTCVRSRIVGKGCEHTNATRDGGGDRRRQRRRRRAVTARRQKVLSLGLLFLLLYICVRMHITGDKEREKERE